MNKKKTLSILLAFVIAFTALISFSRTISADENDPQDTGTDQVEPTEPAPTNDEPTIPDAGFDLVCSTGTITGSGYYNASCSFSPLTFGKVAENKVAKALLMKFDRIGDIFDEAGNRVASFLVTNTQHDMPDNADLQFTVYDSDNISIVKLTVASYISPAVYNSLQSGQYTARIYYSSTWQMIFNIPDYSRAEPTTMPGPGGSIQMPLVVDNSSIIVGPTGTPSNDAASYALSPATYNITNSGFSDIECTFNHLTFGKITGKDGVTSIAESLNLTFRSCTLTDGNGHSFSVEMGEQFHKYHSTGFVFFRSFNSSSNKQFSVPIYIKPADYDSLPAGTYSGRMTYDVNWTTNYTAKLDDDPGYIMLRLVIPESSIIASGDCGATSSDHLTWTLYTNGRLEINGTGEMKDYGESGQSLPPWNVYKNQIKSVKVGSGVNKIGSYAFYQHNELTSLTLADSVWVIGSYAFCECKNLSSISAHNMKAISEKAFYRCEKLIEIESQSDLQYIGEWAFAESGLFLFSIPSTVTQIKRAAFANTDLAAVTIPEGVTVISGDAFMGCENLFSVTIKGNVTDIGFSAFEGCSFTSIELPSTVTYIGHWAFANNPNLKSISIPNGVDIIEPGTFNKCTSLTSVDIPESVTSIGSQAFSYCSFTTLTIPGNVKTIGSCAFEKCEKLTSVVLEEGVQEINNSAFENCKNIITVTIPSTMHLINECAFYGCTSVTAVYCNAAPGTLQWFTVSTRPDFKIATDADPEKTKCYVKSEYLYAFTHSLGDRVNVVFTDGTIDIGSGAHLYGYTLSLAGDIGVNFWMELDGRYDYPENYMLFTVNNRTQKVLVSEAERAQGSPRYRIFSCGVAAKEMTDKVTAQFYLYDGTPVGSEYTYTVREYANYILTHDSYSQKAKTVVKAMLNYGACSQTYFNYRTSSLANSVLPESERCPSIASPNGIGYKTDDYGILIPERVSLSLDSTITLKLYFNSKDVDGFEFKRNGRTLTTSRSGEYTVVHVDRIPALDIQSAVEVDVYRNNIKIGEFGYSPAKYCKIVLGMNTDGTITDELKLLVSTLYYFNSALQNYVQN